MLFKKKTITSIEVVTLHLSGMRFNFEYEIVGKENKSEITKYSMRYEEENDKRIPQRSVEVPTKDVLNVMNKCRVLGWDGFHGKHPRRIKDGTMFTLTATVNGGVSINASGSHNFPKGFHEFRSFIEERLAEK